MKNFEKEYAKWQVDVKKNKKPLKNSVQASHVETFPLIPFRNYYLEHGTLCQKPLSR